MPRSLDLPLVLTPHVLKLRRDVGPSIGRDVGDVPLFFRQRPHGLYAILESALVNRAARLLCARIAGVEQERAGFEPTSIGNRIHG